MEAQIYVVGGAVRDFLLGKEPKDVDFVVTGATPDWMTGRGFKQVGADFPVFLDRDGNEWSLARTERKSGNGYNGFVTQFDPTVTIEDDLARRDLTINAMAVPVREFPGHALAVFREGDSMKNIVDPFNGQHDLKAGILRHTSEAFSEDPLRVLRIARFAARYNFKVASETIDLCRHIVNGGELNTLSKERIWTELYKGFSEHHPEMMLDVLDRVGAVDQAPLKSYLSAVDWSANVLKCAQIMDGHTDVKVLLAMEFLALKSNEEANELKIPTRFTKMAKHVRLLYIAESLIRSLRSDPEVILLVFDDVRSEQFITPDEDFKLAKSAALIKSLCSPNQANHWVEMMSLLTSAARAIKQLDFERITQGDKKTIKDRVRQAKLDAIQSIL